MIDYKKLYFDATTKKVLDDSGLLYVWQKIKAGFTNSIEGVQKNGVDLPIDANTKKVNVTVPTDTNDLTNGAGFQNASQVNSAIQQAIAGITGISFEIVQTLPATGENGVIYLVPNSEGSGSNVYDEYIWITVSGTSRFEKIGSTDLPDLSNYYNTSNLLSLTNAEIDTICT